VTAAVRWRLVIEVVANVVLGLIFLWAGTAKLIAGPLWMKQSADMDVPRALAFPVPYAELVLGVLLVTQLFSPWPAVAGGLLLLAFTVVIVRRIRDGSRPPCSCFGARSTRPLGAIHVLRNLALLAVAVVAVVAGV
jgi:uncharacterized membrane protein YphA (DoxX/SURF4 family)